MTELDLRKLFESESMTDWDVAGRYARQVDLREPYRDDLASLFAQRRALLDELCAKLVELEENDRQISHRVLATNGYKGPGRLGRWLLRRAWERIFYAHGISLMMVLRDLGKRALIPARTENDFGAELRELTREKYGGQSARSHLDLKLAADEVLRALEASQGGPEAQEAKRSADGKPEPIPQPAPGRVFRR